MLFYLVKGKQFYIFLGWMLLTNKVNSLVIICLELLSETSCALLRGALFNDAPHSQQTLLGLDVTVQRPVPAAVSPKFHSVLSPLPDIFGSRWRPSIICMERMGWHPGPSFVFWEILDIGKTCVITHILLICLSLLFLSVAFTTVTVWPQTMHCSSLASCGCFKSLHIQNQ